VNEFSIDAHQHFWQLERGDYDWLTPSLVELYRDFAPSDLSPLMLRSGVARSVVVQAAPTVDETRFLLSLADTTPWLAGVVGWIDFESEDAAETLAELARHPRFVGVRPMVQDIADPDWLLADALTPVFEALIGLDCCFDALVRPLHLPRLHRLMQRHPALRVVVDHGAKPDIAGDRFDATWARDLVALANESGALCKLSGLVTEAAPGWSTDDIRPYAEHLLEHFGPTRLMWGSDWPVVRLARGYADWAEAAEELLSGLDTQARDDVLGGVAARFYRLDAADGGAG
jgi:L-fuconolactonase